MENKKVSVIIPARNEEKFIQRTIEAYRHQEYPLEIIVVVNNSEDKTFEIANKLADKALNFKDDIGVSAARNEGARVASGQVFIFSDADSYLEKGGLQKISKFFSRDQIGNCLTKPATESIKGEVLFFLKNWIHRFKIYEGGIGGVFFCSRDVFLKISGFKEQKRIAEFEDFIRRAKLVGAEYVLATNCYAFTSLRRYEEKGYFKTFIFWVSWKIMSLLKKDERLSEKYFKDA